MFPYSKENLATQVFTLTNSFLFLCLQVLYISLHLFKLDQSLLYKMYIFSFKQILQFLVVGLYEAERRRPALRSWACSSRAANRAAHTNV